MPTIVRTTGCIDESTAVLAVQDIPQLVNEVRQPRVEGTYSNTRASAFQRHTLLQTADGVLACNSRAMQRQDTQRYSNMKQLQALHARLHVSSK